MCSIAVFLSSCYSFFFQRKAEEEAARIKEEELVCRYPFLDSHLVNFLKEFTGCFLLMAQIKISSKSSSLLSVV